jgi:hypothetical protein
MDTLLMPMIGYRIFNIDNYMVRMWGWYMRVGEDRYYEFLIPANIALFVGLNLLLTKFKPQVYKELLTKLTETAKEKGKIGIVLTVIGFIGSFFSGLDSPLAFVFYLFAMLKYVGPFYIYYSDLPFKRKAFYASLIIFFVQAIAQGMFGEFVMYLILSLIVVSIRYKLRFITKLTLFSVGLFLILVLQSVKSTYRNITWGGKEEKGLSVSSDSKVNIFSELFYDRLLSPEEIFNQKAMFGVYARMNQGFLISRAMDYVPRVEPYAEGETIIRSIQAVIVPRVLWPDKPEAGGHENLARFVGIKQRLKYSMNIGPYGEAYGNFGPVYGVVFILLYGLLFSYLFKALLEKSQLRPTLLLWTPLLFFSALTVETDILSTLNSFVKGAVFVATLYWGAKKFFKVSL